jgi:hypothetical protein
MKTTLQVGVSRTAGSFAELDRGPSPIAADSLFLTLHVPGKVGRVTSFRRFKTIVRAQAKLLDVAVRPYDEVHTDYATWAYLRGDEHDIRLHAQTVADLCGVTLAAHEFL